MRHQVRAAVVGSVIMSALAIGVGAANAAPSAASPITTTVPTGSSDPIGALLAFTNLTGSASEANASGSASELSPTGSASQLNPTGSASELSPTGSASQATCFESSLSNPLTALACLL